MVGSRWVQWVGASALVCPALVGCRSSDSERIDEEDEAAETVQIDEWTPGGGTASDGVSPRIVDGYPGCIDAGTLGIVGLFTVEVEDPNDDVFGRVLLLALKKGDSCGHAIDDDEAAYNPATGTVSLTFSNVEPGFCRVQLQVEDADGYASNVWSGDMTG